MNWLLTPVEFSCTWFGREVLRLCAPLGAVLALSALAAVVVAALLR